MHAAATYTTAPRYLSQSSVCAPIHFRTLQCSYRPCVVTFQIRLGLPDISHLMATGPQAHHEEEEVEEVKEEKIIFGVQLAAYDPSIKVKIIKEIRKMTDLTLKDVCSLCF